MLTMIPEIKDGYSYPMIVPAGGESAFLWGVDFKLPYKGHKGGFVVQRIVVEDRRTSGGHVTVTPEEYWEAWPVEAGSDNPLGATRVYETLPTFMSPGRAVTTPGGVIRLHDWWAQSFRHVSSPSGPTTTVFEFFMAGCACFFEMRKLPRTFLQDNVDRAASMPATTQKPGFWTNFGNTRYLKFKWTSNLPGKPPNSATLKILRHHASFLDGGPSLASSAWEDHSGAARR